MFHSPKQGETKTKMGHKWEEFFCSFLSLTAIKSKVVSDRNLLEFPTTLAHMSTDNRIVVVVHSVPYAVPLLESKERRNLFPHLPPLGVDVLLQGFDADVADAVA